MSDTLDLYGVKVPAHEWVLLRRLANTLYECTMSGVPEKRARKQCVLLAMRAREEARHIR